MTERIVSEEREAALIRLLDDPSPVVQQALTAEFRRIGPAAAGILQRAVREGCPQAREQAKLLLDSLMGADPGRMLVDFIRSLQYDLETGLFLINRVINPALQVQPVKDGLDLLARRCRELFVAQMTPRERCKLVNRVLFHEYGFRGNVEDYEDPLNSCIEAVLRRRKGLPVTLSAVYLLVAQRIGLELEPISMPGHFMVGCFHGSEPFFIDPFERGRFRSLAEIRELLESRHIAPGFHHIAPVPVGEVLCRVCRNLVAHFDRRKASQWAGRFRVFVREFEQTHQRHNEA